MLEEGFSDYEFQMLLLRRDGATVRDRMLEIDKNVEPAIQGLSDEELYAVFANLGWTRSSRTSQSFA